MLPQGQLVGTVAVHDIIGDSDSIWAQQGKWHWLLKRPIEFRRPIPIRGAQGLFIPEVSPRTLGQAQRHAIKRRQKKIT